MKKITFFSLFLITAFVLNAQKTYNFMGSANPGNWEFKGSGISSTPSANGIVLEFGAGTPRLDITRANDPFSVASGSYAVITLINNSTEIEIYRMQYDKNSTGGSGTQFLGWTGVLKPATSPGNGVQQTVVFPLSSSHYNNDGGGTGTEFTNDSDDLDNMEYIAIAFRNASAANLTSDSATNGNVIIQKIEIVKAGDLEKNDFNFNSDDLTGFTVSNAGAATVSVANNTLTFNGDSTKDAPKIAQTFYGVDASASRYAHIIVENNSSNADQLKFQFVDGSAATQTYGVQTLNSGTQTSLDIDLSGKAEWTGIIKDWRLVLTNSTAANIDNGSVSISKIVFDNNATLSNTSFEKSVFTIFPNPAKNQITINSINTIGKVALYNVLGKKVLEENNTNRLNISSLKSGIYLVKIIDAKNNVSTQKLLIN